MNELDYAWDELSRISTEIHRQDEISKLRERRHQNEAKTCGNCNHWMKNSCVPEKELGLFRSCGSFGCKDFIRKDYITSMVIELTAELNSARAS